MATSYLHQPDAPRSSSPAASAGAATPRSSALSSKITSVLSASYSDLEIRDALETLDARGVRNTAETRRRLRLDVQKEVIQCNGEIVLDFGKVAEQLKRIGSAIASLNKSCEDMRAHVLAASKETDSLVADATTLLRQRAQVEQKQSLLDAFNKHFIVSEADLTALTSTAEPVNDQFFQVLTRVKRIHQDCQVLLGTEDQHLGLEILENSSKQLNAAFQKLYRWIQREFKTLDLENPQINASIRRALRVLAERPTLFQNCLDSFAEAREHNLSDSFYTALTGTSSNLEQAQISKPIEFHAHDPLRYVGDMLAWAHSATVSEREALEVLFISEGDEIARSIQEGLESEPWSRPDEDEVEVFDGRKALNELVSRGLAGVARHLRQRTEQAIQTQEDATLAYKVSNLIRFYKTTFAKLIGDDSPIFEVLNGLEESALRQFRGNMRDHVASVQNELTVAPVDLSPPEFLEEALGILSALIKSYDTSFSTTKGRDSNFQSVLTEALDPFISGCENLYRRLAEPRNDIFAINCLLATRATLQPYSFLKDRVSEMQDTIKEHARKLILHQHQYLLRSSGLETLVVALSSLSDSSEDVASIPSLGPFQPDALSATSQRLDDFLPSALMDAMENIKQLQNTKMAQDITEEAANRFCEDFEFVESRVMAADDAGGLAGSDDEEPSLRDLFPRTSGEIRVLLS